MIELEWTVQSMRWRINFPLTRTGWIGVSGTSCLLAAIVATPAAAQREGKPLSDGPLFRDDVAGTRTDPGNALARIRLDSFVVDPAISLSSGYDSNVFNQNQGQSDAFAVLRPRVTVSSDWSRHSLAFDLNGAIRRNARLTAENAESYQTTARGGLSIGQRSTLSLSVSGAREAEPRGTGGVGNGNAEPVIRRDVTGSAGGTFAIGNIGFNLRGVAKRQRFDPVLRRDNTYARQSFRNIDGYSASIEAGVPIGTNLTSLLVAAYDSERSPDAVAALDRTSNGVTMQVGLKGYVSQLIAAEVRVGLRTRAYDNERYSDFRGVHYAATVDWYVLRLVSLRAAADRYFANSGIGNAAGVQTTRERLSIFYDPTASLRVVVNGGRAQEQYRDANLRVTRLDADVTAQYQLARRWSASLQLAWRDASSNDQNIIDSYSATSLSLGATYKF